MHCSNAYCFAYSDGNILMPLFHNVVAQQRLQNGFSLALRYFPPANFLTDAMFFAPTTPTYFLGLKIFALVI